MDLGQRVRELRKERRFSQTELAIRAGVARNTLNRIENGHLMPTAPVIEQLAEALDVVPGALFEEPAVPLDEASDTGQPEAEVPDQGRPIIKVPIADAVGVSDSVRRTLEPQFEVLIYTLKTNGLSKQAAEIERVRDEVLVA
jgi:transcriptional regulator with XRE-family HTH domain